MFVLWHDRMDVFETLQLKQKNFSSKTAYMCSPDLHLAKGIPRVFPERSKQQICRSGPCLETLFPGTNLFMITF